MGKTADDFLKTLIGDLVLTNAQFAGQIAALQEQNDRLTAALAPTPPITVTVEPPA
jgi:hypothetical protein